MEHVSFGFIISSRRRGGSAIKGELKSHELKGWASPVRGNHVKNIGQPPQLIVPRLLNSKANLESTPRWIPWIKRKKKKKDRGWWKPLYVGIASVVVIVSLMLSTRLDDQMAMEK